MPSRSGVCEAAATSVGHEGAAPACITYQRDQARGTGARNASMPPVRALSSRDYAIVFFCFVCVSVVDSIYRPARMVDRDMFSLALVLAALAAIVFAAALMRLSHHATFGTVTRIVTPVLCLSLFLAAYLPEKLLYVAYAITFASMTVTVIFIWIAGILHSARTEGGLRKSLGLPLGFHYAGAVVGSLMAPLLDVMGVAALAFLLTIAACSVVIARSHDAEGQPPLIVPAYRDLRSDRLRAHRQPLRSDRARKPDIRPVRKRKKFVLHLQDVLHFKEHRRHAPQAHLRQNRRPFETRPHRPGRRRGRPARRPRCEVERLSASRHRLTRSSRQRTRAYDEGRPVHFLFTPPARVWCARLPRLVPSPLRSGDCLHRGHVFRSMSVIAPHEGHVTILGRQLSHVGRHI